MKASTRPERLLLIAERRPNTGGARPLVGGARPVGRAPEDSGPAPAAGRARSGGVRRYRLARLRTAPRPPTAGSNDPAAAV